MFRHVRCRGQLRPRRSMYSEAKQSSSKPIPRKNLGEKRIMLCTSFCAGLGDYLRNLVVDILETRSISWLLCPAGSHQHLHDKQSGAVVASSCKRHHVAEWSVRAFLFHCNHRMRIASREYKWTGTHERVCTRTYECGSAHRHRYASAHLKAPP